MAITKKLSTVEAKRIQEIMQDPVKWAQVFVTIFDNAAKKKTPWIARWYQVEMLRDRSIKKVARCGRRTGKCFALMPRIDGERLRALSTNLAW